MKNTVYAARRALPAWNCMASADVVFRPALTPLEAAMIPAQERKHAYGALALARRPFAFEAETACQRQKIWVR